MLGMMLIQAHTAFYILENNLKANYREWCQRFFSCRFARQWPQLLKMSQFKPRIPEVFREFHLGANPQVLGLSSSASSDTVAGSLIGNIAARSRTGTQTISHKAGELHLPQHNAGYKFLAYNCMFNSTSFDNYLPIIPYNNFSCKT